MKTRYRSTASLLALAVTALCWGLSLHAQQLTPPLPLPVILHVPSLVDSIEVIAGHPVRVLDARVIEVIDPRAILVESATNYRTIRGQRDRIIVFIEDGKTRHAPELAIGSAVTVEGVARTILSLHVTNEVAWPARLDRREVQRSEVSGAIVRAAIVTAEGVDVAGGRDKED